MCHSPPPSQMIDWPLIWGNISPCCLSAAISPAASTGDVRCWPVRWRRWRRWWRWWAAPAYRPAANHTVGSVKLHDLNASSFLPLVSAESNGDVRIHAHSAGSAWESTSVGTAVGDKGALAQTRFRLENTTVFFYLVLSPSVSILFSDYRPHEFPSCVQEQLLSRRPRTAGFCAIGTRDKSDSKVTEAH